MQSSTIRSDGAVRRCLFLIRRYPELDWEVLSGSRIQGWMASPLFVTLNYLSEKFNVPIPTHVLAALYAAACQSESTN